MAPSSVNTTPPVPQLAKAVTTSEMSTVAARCDPVHRDTATLFSAPNSLRHSRHFDPSQYLHEGQSSQREQEFILSRDRNRRSASQVPKLALGAH
jgi:hypothetical protein